MNKTAFRVVIFLLIAALLGGGAWWYLHPRRASDDLVLFGNVELRQVTLAFNGSERIAEVLVEEGNLVHSGQVLAQLDTSRLAPQVAQAEAQVASQEAIVNRLRNGSRPEEIAQARAQLEAARAEALNARRQFERREALAARSIASEQETDIAKAASDIADAKVIVNQRALELAIAGPRQEEIAQAQAQLRVTQAQLALLRQQLADTELKSPVDAVVRSRLMEAGEMASTTRPVFSLATKDPKWVRAYVSETQLGHVVPGMPAAVTSGQLPGSNPRRMGGLHLSGRRVHPESVQTEDLRTSLVYEVRVFVKDPDNQLRLGMPATVKLIADKSETSPVAQQSDGKS